MRLPSSLSTALLVLTACSPRPSKTVNTAPSVGSEALTELRVNVLQHDGSPPSAGVVELRSADGRGTLAHCDLAQLSTCDLSNDHRGLAWIEASAPEHLPLRLGFFMTDEAVTLDLTLGTAPVDTNSEVELESRAAPVAVERKAPKMVANPAASVAAQTARVSLDLLQTYEQTSAAAEAALSSGAPIRHAEIYEPLLDRLSKIVATTRQPEVRAIALVAALSLWGIDDDRVSMLSDRALAELGPTDDLWSLTNHSLAWALQHSSTDMTAYGDAAIANHPNPEVAGQVLLRRVIEADEDGSLDAARAAFDVLVSKRFAGTSAQADAPSHDPDRPIKPGKPLPPVIASTPSLPGKPGHQLDWTAEMKGHVFVLELWATWCKPCLYVMPQIHEIHAAYHARGLEIVSISLDYDPSAVNEHRKTWPMPWTHACVGGEPMRRLFELFDAQLPRTVIVDADGIIRAVDPHGEEFQEHLDALLPGQ